MNNRSLRVIVIDKIGKSSIQATGTRCQESIHAMNITEVTSLVDKSNMFNK